MNKKTQDTEQFVVEIWFQNGSTYVFKTDYLSKSEYRSLVESVSNTDISSFTVSEEVFDVLYDGRKVKTFITVKKDQVNLVKISPKKFGEYNG